MGYYGKMLIMKNDFPYLMKLKMNRLPFQNADSFGEGPGAK